MSDINDHLKFLKEMGKFNVDCNHIIFNKGEMDLLEKFGHWYNALTTGKLSPISVKQKDFIINVIEKKKPMSTEEIVWFKYLGRKKIEEKCGNILSTPPNLIEDSFYNRNMAKKMKSMMFSEMKKNHR